MLQTVFYPTGIEGKSARFLQVDRITQTSKDNHLNGSIGYKIIEQYLHRLQSVEAVAAVTDTKSASVFQDDRVVEVVMRHTDAAYWKILEFQVLAGRVLNADDLEQGRFVAVLSALTAKKLFSATDNISYAPRTVVGKKINVMGQIFEVIGVVEDASMLNVNAYSGLWAPITTLPSSSYRTMLGGEFNAILLAKNTADIPHIKAEVLRAAAQINADDPNRWEHTYMWADSRLDYVARTLLNNSTVPDSGAPKLLTIITGAMLLFMLLPALNLINLNASRIMERASEIGVRKAFGASQRQLLFQFVMENILLCIVGGAIGVVLAKAVSLWLSSTGVVPFLQLELNWQLLACGFAISVVFGLLSGVIPAWRMARLDPILALKGGA